MGRVRHITDGADERAPDKERSPWIESEHNPGQNGNAQHQRSAAEIRNTRLREGRLQSGGEGSRPDVFQKIVVDTYCSLWHNLYMDNVITNETKQTVVRHFVLPKPQAKGGWQVYQVLCDENGKESTGRKVSEHSTKKEAETVKGRLNASLVA